MMMMMCDDDDDDDVIMMLHTAFHCVISPCRNDAYFTATTPVMSSKNA